MNNLSKTFGTRLLPNEFFCGVELEIESVSSSGDLQDFEWVEIDKDDSLRNNGLEFKILPSTFKEAIARFKLVHANLKLGKEPYTHRTSTHVHVNVGNFTAIQLKQFVLLYAACEQLFLDYVGEERQHNIFCVPLCHTNVPSLYSHDAETMTASWSKYAAFNILPVRTLGTVEFRHLYGTADVEIFTHWLGAIKDLYTYIEQRPSLLVIKEMSNIQRTLRMIREATPLLSNVYSDLELIEKTKDGCLDVKLSTGNF